MNKDHFTQYNRIRKKLNDLIFLGVDSKTLGELVTAWTGVDSITAYKWVHYSQENQNKKNRYLSTMFLALLWIGGLGIGFLLFLFLGIFYLANPMTQELISLLSFFAFWLGLFGSLMFSKLRFNLL